jgi:gluconate 5-dehydrogenase
MHVKDLFQLEGKVALITGGSRGLGLQMAEALGEMGCRVAITARKADELAEAKAHLEGFGIEVHTIVNDLAKFDRIPDLVSEVLGVYDHIDILVNNAGATWGAPAEDYPDEAWHKVMNLNINAPFFLAREVGKRSMIPRRSGKIINFASIAGLKGAPAGMLPITPRRPRRSTSRERWRPNGAGTTLTSTPSARAFSPRRCRRDCSPP